MKATGVIRKIDDLGRIVIPKEIRKSLRIREGDPLEIYVESDGEIILKKYAPLGDLVELSQQYVDALNKTTGFVACITDNTTIIAISGISKAEYLDKEISEHILNVMDERIIWSTKDDSPKPLIKDDKQKYVSQIIAPIISDGDAIGSVILFSIDYKNDLTDVEYKLAQSSATFLGKQMEV